ncbi:glycosyltransferase [Rufibacter immobilis]|uniref:glycosyltransferase n=1 Tax=Rufibacter immobilis TaxID=1348778 RepID=UPI0035EBD3E5
MTVLLTLIQAVFYGLAIYLAWNCCYLLFFAVAGLRKIKPIQQEPAVYRKICVLIPAYRENAVILETSKAALHHYYHGTFDVFVIADGLAPETIVKLQAQYANVIQVNFDRSTKGKALLAAMQELSAHTYDIAVVLDVDNIMGINFLNEVNRAFDAGYSVVQAHRTAKNTGTSFAFLDACNEEINNHIYRKGHFALGFSAALIGSGMAFDFAYFKRLLEGIGETVGEDKELDFRIAKDQVKICYLDQVYVYDEKIETAQVFTQQRTRWIAAQVEFMKKFALEGFRQLLQHSNLEFFNKTLQAFLVPRMLLIGILCLLFLQSWVNPYGLPPVFWGVLLAMLATALLLSLPARLYQDKRFLKAVLRLPYALFCMCLALLRIKKAKKSFLPTPHKAATSPAIIN